MAQQQLKLLSLTVKFSKGSCALITLSYISLGLCNSRHHHQLLPHPLLILVVAKDVKPKRHKEKHWLTKAG